QVAAKRRLRGTRLVLARADAARVELPVGHADPPDLPAVHLLVIDGHNVTLPSRRYASPRRWRRSFGAARARPPEFLVATAPSPKPPDKHQSCDPDQLVNRFCFCEPSRWITEPRRLVQREQPLSMCKFRAQPIQPCLGGRVLFGLGWYVLLDEFPK